MRRLALAVLVAIAAAHAPEARAGNPDRTVVARANALFERAQKHFQAGEYTAAIALFTEAYELVRDPVYLFNLAQTHRKVLDCLKADEFYRRYLADATDADAKQRERVEQWLREMAPCVEHRREESELARRAEEAERARRAEELRLQREAASRPIDRGRGLRIGGIVVASVGLVGLGAGGWYTVRGRSIRDDLAKDCSDGCDWAQLLDENAAGERANTRAMIGWIAGGVATAGGVTLYLLGRSRIERVQLAPLPGGAAVSARLSF